jgi:glycosyltransferase involved in cell wall biosynthesis
LHSVSIIIPFRDSQEWLSETLSSVEAQAEVDAAEIEVILVDNGSSDRSRLIAEEYARASRFSARTIEAPEPGASRARNVGAANSLAPWLCFVDSDDIVDTYKLKVQLCEASRADKQVAVLYSAYANLHQLSGQWQVVGSPNLPALDQGALAASLLGSANFIQLGSTLIRKSCFEAVRGFDEGFHIVHDVNLYIRMAIAGFGFQLVKTPSPVLGYRRRTLGSLSNMSKAVFLADCLRNIDIVMGHYRDMGSLHDRRVMEPIVHALAFLARAYASTDWSAFKIVYRRLTELEPGYLPRSPTHLRLLSALLGYPMAERVAVSLRKIRAHRGACI